MSGRPIGDAEFPAIGRSRPKVRRLARWFVPVCVTALLLGIGMGPCMGAGAITANRGAKAQNVTLTFPVVTCATRDALSFTPDAKPYGHATAVVPRSLEHRVALYADADREMAPLLAPKGWHCRVSVGADGSASFDLYPSKIPPPLSRYSNAPQVVATTDGGCQGCVADDVCPYFVNAQSQVGLAGLHCPGTRPPFEQVHFLSGSPAASQGTVDTYDPPTTKSRYGTYGVLRYVLAGSQGLDARETCVLAHRAKSWCQAITGEFVAHNWELALLDRPVAMVPVPTPTTVTTSSTLPASTIPPTTIPPTTQPPPAVTPAPTVSSEERFIDDALAQVPGVDDAVNEGITDSSYIGEYGENICALLPQDAGRSGSGQAAYNAIADEFIEGETTLQLSTTDAEAFVSLAIRDICSQYQSYIPAGDPG
jgi:hypothetical protein